MQKILIVDDVPANIKALIEVLKDSNYDIFAATSGAIALKIAMYDPPRSDTFGYHDAGNGWLRSLYQTQSEYNNNTGDFYHSTRR
jgi:hypothetical protein